MVAHILERGQYLQVIPKAGGELLGPGVLGIVEVANSQHAVGCHIKGKVAVELGVVDFISEFNRPEANARCVEATQQSREPPPEAIRISVRHWRLWPVVRWYRRPRVYAGAAFGGIYNEDRA